MIIKLADRPEPGRAKGFGRDALARQRCKIPLHSRPCARLRCLLRWYTQMTLQSHFGLLKYALWDLELHELSALPINAR